MPTFPARYQPLDLLGRGGMGEVWRVRCRETGDEQALKVCLQPDEVGRFLFRQEIWAMSTLRHPTLVPVLDQGETEEGFPYLTMPLIAGQDAAPTLSEQQVRAFLPGLLSGLDFLHSRGFVHGDIKPENLRLPDDGGVRLMDLGLLHRSGRPSKISGTLAYVSPELILGRAIDGRSDLYMLGAVLYELLSGEPPFAVDAREELLRAHVSRVPGSLREKNREVSVVMETVVHRLLAKDPAERYDSGQAVLSALGLDFVDDDTATLWPPPMVGREGVQVALQNWVQDTAANSLVWGIQGASGMGKTRLLQELQAHGQLAGRVCLLTGGQGLLAAPYSGLADGVKQLWNLATAETLDRLGPFLAPVLPSLGDNAAPALEGAAERTRFFDAVAALAESVGEAIIWCIDDFDQLDADALALFNFLRQRRASGGWRWLLSAESFTETMASSVHIIGLEPLQPQQIHSMLVGMAGGEVPDEVYQQTLRLTEGIPGSVPVLLQHWVQRGTLKKRRGEWGVVDREALSLPVQALGITSLPLLALPDDALALLQHAALLGERGALSDLAALSACSEASLFETGTTLENLGVLAFEQGGYRFLRPALVAAALAKLDPQTLRARQQCTAVFLAERYPLPQCIERRDLPRLLEICQQFLQAECFEEA